MPFAGYELGEVTNPHPTAFMNGGPSPLPMLAGWVIITTYDLRGRIRLEGSSMPLEDYKLGEVTELAKVIYQEKIKHLVEPGENGKFIVIDVESGDYEIDEEMIPASDRLYARRPNAAAYGGRVGYPTTYDLSGSIRVI